MADFSEYLIWIKSSASETATLVGFGRAARRPEQPERRAGYLRFS